MLRALAKDVPAEGGLPTSLRPPAPRAGHSERQRRPAPESGPAVQHWCRLWPVDLVVATRGRFNCRRAIPVVVERWHMAMQEMRLVWPSSEHLPDYVAALERGWFAENLRGEVAAREELATNRCERTCFSRESGRYRSDRLAGHASEMAPPSRDFRATDGGSGTASSVAASDFVGSAGPRLCLLTVLAISATQ